MGGPAPPPTIYFPWRGQREGPARGSPKGQFGGQEALLRVGQEPKSWARSLPTPHLSGNLPGVSSAREGERREPTSFISSSPRGLAHTHQEGEEEEEEREERQPGPGVRTSLGQVPSRDSLPVPRQRWHWLPSSGAALCNLTLGSPGDQRQKAEAETAAGCQQ